MTKGDRFFKNWAPSRALCRALCWAVSVAAVGAATAADWPTWRHDAGRTGVSPEELSGALRRQWTRRGEPLTPAWAEDPRLQFDAAYEPIVSRGTIFVASGRNDSVTALRVSDGAEVWRCFADGPVRLAPVADGDRLYFGADDGCLYCVRSETGELLWRIEPFRDRKALGNARLISTYPVRGGPVLADGQLHWTAGFWPFEGAFLYATDVRRPTTGAPEHSLTSLEHISPQGHIAAAGGSLYLPCGRSKVSAVDPHTGTVLDLPYDSKGLTDHHVVASGAWVFHGGKIVDRERGVELTNIAYHPVVSGGIIYSANAGVVEALDLSEIALKESKDRKGAIVRSYTARRLWKLKNAEVVHEAEVKRLLEQGTADAPDAAYLAWLAQNPLVVAIQAGSRLYGWQDKTLFAIDVPGSGPDPGARTEPVVAWQEELEERPASLVAAGGRLLVSTLAGSLISFGAESAAPVELARPGPQAFRAPGASDLDGDRERWRALVREGVEAAGSRDGYCLLLGLGSGALLEALLAESSYSIIAFEADPEKIVAFRRLLDADRLQGTRVSILPGRALSQRLSPYIASLITAESLETQGSIDEVFAERLFALLRPYGGAACLPLSPQQHLALGRWLDRGEHPDGKLIRLEDRALLRREGALPGSADWGREYGDDGNTLMSHDTLVKAPLGVLWYGGPAGDPELFYNRHNWPPSLTVVDGRLFIQGPGDLAALDIYTGRMLWKTSIIDGGGSVRNRIHLTKVSPDRMGNPSFGLPAAGYNFLAAKDAVYLAYPERCLVIDPLTGAQIGELRLPSESDIWGRIHVHKDLLIVQVVSSHKASVESGAGGKADGSREDAEEEDPDRQQLPGSLIALDRRTGEVRWVRKATNAFPFVALGRGRVYCFDADLERLYRDKRRQNGVPKSKTDRVALALDADTGETVWSVPMSMTAAWLSFSEERNIVIASSSEEIVALHGNDGYGLWSKKSKAEGFGGHPENLVHKVILWHDRVIDQRGPGLAYDLATGAEIKVLSPLTGEEVPWEFTKSGHHCNYAIASEHLLTFRAATAGYCDLDGGGTGRLEGFRSGCRNSLIPAGGVLNAPNFANGCICSYSIFTSLALVHVPENNEWTYGALKVPTGRLRRIGVNLGAPGDRKADDGTYWIDFPSVGGPSPDLPITIEPAQPRWFCNHTSQSGGDGLAWVTASGAVGITSITLPLVAPPPPPASAEATAGASTAPAQPPAASPAPAASPSSPSEPSLPAAPTAPSAPTYTVRLHFAEPDLVKPGDRVFSVSVQGQEVLHDLDILALTGGRNLGLVKEVRGVKVPAALRIDLSPSAGAPVLAGVEVAAED